MIEKLKALPTRTKILISTLIVVIVLALTSSLVNFYKPPTVPPRTYTEAPAIPKLAAIPKVKLEVKEIEVIPKETVVKVIHDLPPEVKDNPNVEVTNTATTGPTKTGYNIVATYDKKDGKTSIYYTEKERKLFEFEDDKSVSVAYGVSSVKGQQVIRLNGDWSFFRVGEVHIAAELEAKIKQMDSIESSAFIKATYKW